MNKKIDLNDLLASASDGRYFGDGSAERVWNKAMAARKKTRPAFFRAIPAAAVCLALVCVFAVPQARDAVLYFLGSVVEHVDKGSAVQPVNTTPSMTLAAGVPSIQTVSGIKPGGEWVNSLQAGIKKVEYDGEYLNVTFEVAGKGLDHFVVYPAPESGKSVDAKEFSAASLVINGQRLQRTGSLFPETLNQDGQYEMGATFNAEICEGFSGVVEATLNIDCVNMTFTGDGGGTGYPVGTLQLHFTFDVSAGNAAIKRSNPVNESYPLSGKIIVTEDVNDTVNNKEIYTNKEITLDGCSAKVVSILMKAAETEIKLEIKPSVQFTESMLNAFTTGISATVLCNSTDVSKGLSISDDNNIVSLVLTARNIPGETDKLTINLYSFHSTAINGVPLEQNKPYPIDLNTKDSSSANEASLSSDSLFGTFDINLPQ